MPIIKAIADKAAGGRPYLIYPEGKTSFSNERLLDFQTGCFMASLLSKTPIVPVVIYDAHEALNSNNVFKKVRTQLYYLKPILYEEYGRMNRKKVAALVQSRIQEKLDEINRTKNQ
jgi:1-acyl-sn-glycerol-3-phosphate acyltransferase